MTRVTCVDISEFQQNIDFNKMKNDGIKAVIIRAGYGREVSQKDSMFESHYKNAKNANLKIGVYWYSYADSVSDAEKEAKACLECIKNKSIDMPIYYDLEDYSMVKLGKTKLTAIAERFCETIKKSNYRAGVYANLNWFNNCLDYDELKRKYSIWLAQYNSVNELNCDIWQNSSTGKINGYGGNIDTNVIFNYSVFSKSESKVEKPTIEYCVFADNKWLPSVKGLSDFAGIAGEAISGLAIRVSKGKVKYRVHTKGGRWLNWVTGFNIEDDVNGYAGILGVEIDAVQVYYTTPKDVKSAHGSCYKATYRVSSLSENYYDWQHDDEKDSKQDGYAGSFCKAIDRVQITLT